MTSGCVWLHICLCLSQLELCFSLLTVKSIVIGTPPICNSYLKNSIYFVVIYGIKSYCDFLCHLKNMFYICISLSNEVPLAFLLTFPGNCLSPVWATTSGLYVIFYLLFCSLRLRVGRGRAPLELPAVLAGILDYIPSSKAGNCPLPGSVFPLRARHCLIHRLWLVPPTQQ